MTIETIVIYEGIICKWGTIKHFVSLNEVTTANADEVRAYYMIKLR